METPSVTTRAIIRPCVEADIVHLTTALEGSLHTSLPRAVHDHIDIFDCPADFPEKWSHKRLWIVEKEAKILGYIAIWKIDQQHKGVEFVSAFIQQVAEKDVLQAFQSLLKIFFRKNKFHKISLLIHPDQSFFFTIAQQLSLILEGTLRDHICVHGQWFDVAIFSQLMEEKKDLIDTSQCDFLKEKACCDDISIFVVRAIILKIHSPNIEVLLLKKTETLPFSGLEEPPGGRMHKNETFTQALKRAVKKESGLTIEPEIHFLTSFDFSTETGQRVREFVFRVRCTNHDVHIDSATHDVYQWIPLQELPSSPLHPDLIQILSTYSSHEQETVACIEQESTVEYIPLPIAPLKEALLSGVHLDSYAAKRFSKIEPIGFVLRDSSTKIVGGFLADCEYGVFITYQFWIHPDWRKLGWDKKVLEKIEQVAKEKKCTSICISIMDWEDPPFFQRQGYLIEHQLSGFSQGSRKFIFRKSFAAP